MKKIISGGDGLGYYNGKACFVPFSVPDDVVEVSIVEEKKGFNRCKLEKIIQPSSKRVEPFCKYYGICGGCNIQHIDYESQLDLKRSIILDLFYRNGKIELNDFVISKSRERGYRNRVQFHKKGDIYGFKRKSDNDIVSIDSCPLLVDGLNIVLMDKYPGDDGRYTLFSNGNDFYTGDVDGECSANIMGKDIFFNPGSFFQSNLYILPELINRVNSYIKGPVVMDLYCGVGLFSSFFPDSIEKIIAVEMDKKVKPFVEKNLNGKNFSFYPLSLENYIKRLKGKKEGIDTVLVDPPRKGLSDSVRKYIIKAGFKRVLYVSCDPATMARGHWGSLQLWIQSKIF